MLVPERANFQDDSIFSENLYAVPESSVSLSSLRLDASVFGHLTKIVRISPFLSAIH